jgi:hypothetical protein
MAKQIRDIGASVRARLLALARHRNQQFDLVLTRYALERLLYRLSTLVHKSAHVLLVMQPCGVRGRLRS